MSDDPIHHFEGSWQGAGKFSGMEATAHSQWEWVLAGRFLRLSLRYEMKTPDGGKQSFEGHGYYQAKGAGRFEGRWFDSQGNTYPINGTLQNNTLTSLWGEPDKATGRSIYKINEAEKTLEITDSLHQPDGVWKEFSRFKLTQGR